MITLFTTAKSFLGDARGRQLNALKSWKSLCPDIDIILFGDGPGYAETAQAFGSRHIRDVKTSDKGTPLVSSMFAEASKLAKYDILAYANCDMIFFEDFVRASLTPVDGRFMMVGQRWDMDVKEEIDVETPGWQARLKGRLRPWSLHPPTGSDYFVFRRGTFDDLPPMVVGRAGYDTWLIYHCRLKNIKVIDVSSEIIAIHQNHDYSHLKKGKDEAWTGSEATSNLSLAGGWDNIFTLVDADYRLCSGRVEKNRSRGGIYRRAEAWLVLQKNSLLGMELVLRLLRDARAAALRSPFFGAALVAAGIKSAASKSPVRVITGAGGISHEGWISTDIRELNILKEDDWNRYFSEGSVDAMLAEHVWEHLSAEDAEIAVRNCYRYLKPGGYLRAAVPDGLHPSKEYIAAVKPGGTGSGASDHKVLYTYKTIETLFRSAGFDVDLLEWFDEEGNFHKKDWSESMGLIMRTSARDPRNENGTLNYTSIMLDAWRKE
jgi:predicted SAM-dependent methyltransferase